MSNSILGLKGLTLPSSSYLIAAYGNGFVNVATGIGYGISLDTTKNVEMDVFLKMLFFQNFSDTPLTFDGTNWGRANVARVPIAKYIKTWNQRMFIAYPNIAGTDYPSRVLFSDLPLNNTLTWGIEWGTNLVQTAQSNRVDSANAGFSAYNIKRGDPFFILTGPNAGQYIVASVSSDQTIILATPLSGKAPITFASTGDTYFVTGNYFDCDADDGDFITGLGENNFYFFPQFLTFKKDSLYRFDGAKNLKVYGAFGTTSGRSIVNIHELTLYFYGASGLSTGIYIYDGRESVKSSGAIEHHIAGISPNMYDKIVGWREEELARFYVGDIVNTDFNINIPKAVITFDYNTKAWSIDPIGDVITVSTLFRSGSIKQSYLGTDSSKILLTPSGNTFNGSPVPWKFQTTVYFPSGTDIINKFTRIQIYHENAEGMKVKRKYHLNPFQTEEDFTGLGMLTTERTEFFLDENDTDAAGIQLEFIGTEQHNATALIKKIMIFYRPKTNVLQ